jgi:hypothetical protein
VTCLCKPVSSRAYRNLSQLMSSQFLGCPEFHSHSKIHPPSKHNPSQLSLFTFCHSLSPSFSMSTSLCKFSPLILAINFQLLFQPFCLNSVNSFNPLTLQNGNLAQLGEESLSHFNSIILSLYIHSNDH